MKVVEERAGRGGQEEEGRPARGVNTAGRWWRGGPGGGPVTGSGAYFGRAREDNSTKGSGMILLLRRSTGGGERTPGPVRRVWWWATGVLGL